MSTKRPGFAGLQPVPVVRAEPLNIGDLRFVRDMLAEFAPGWCAELDGICADEATLVIVPEHGDDEAGPSFVISREAFGYRLNQVHWDELRDLGIASTLADAMAAVRHILLLDAVRHHEGSRTVH